MRIACGQRLDLTIGQHRFIQVLAGTGRRFSAHHLGYEPLLCLNELPRISVKRPFRHIAVDEHLFVGISLPEGPALTLLYVSRSFFADSSIHACLFRSLLLRFVSVP